MADVDVMIADLERLVSTESPSRDLAALAASASVLAGLITERTGRSPQLIETEAGPIVHWSGGGTPRVVLIGHHDTVFPMGELAERPFRVADGIATGPGVFDMKAGIVQAIHAVASLSDPAGVEMLWTADEEVGSLASYEMIRERSMAAGAALVLEPSGDGGAVKIARKGTGTYRVTLHGKAAHAGLEPEKGVNALVEAAHQLLVINGFGDPAVGTTVTPTVARAGTTDNVVPALAELLVDARVEQPGEKERLDAAFAALAPVDARIRLEVWGGIGRPPMPASASASLFPLALAAAADLGIEIEGVAVGGGSDGNFTAAFGVPTLDGLGAVGGGAHGVSEHVVVAEMPVRAALLAGIIARLQHP